MFTWAVMDPQDRHRDRQRRQSSTSSATTSLPEAFGWQAVQTADGPDLIRVIENIGHAKDHLKPIRHSATLEVSDHDVDAEPFPEINTGGVNVVRYAVQTAVNAGSELLIFVPRAAHGHDLSSQFVAGRQARARSETAARIGPNARKSAL